MNKLSLNLSIFGIVLVILVSGCTSSTPTDQVSGKVSDEESVRQAVQGYMTAITGEDYLRAYSFINPVDKAKCSAGDFVTLMKFVKAFGISLEDVQYNISSVEITGNNAVVKGTLIYSDGRPAGGASSSTTDMIREEGKWWVVAKDLDCTSIRST